MVVIGVLSFAMLVMMKNDVSCELFSSSNSKFVLYFMECFFKKIVKYYVEMNFNSIVIQSTANLRKCMQNEPVYF